MLEGKSFTLFPEQRADTNFTPWDYHVVCVADNVRRPRPDRPQNRGKSHAISCDFRQFSAIFSDL